MTSSVSPDGLTAGGGETGALIRSRDWSASPLGPMDGWPTAIRSALDLCLHSPAPVIVWFGTASDRLHQFYNDAYRPVLGRDKHPRAMGAPGSEIWPEIWDIMGPIFDAVLREGRSVRRENQHMVLERNGFAEPTWFNHAHSPIRDAHGRIVGVFTIVSETTEAVQAQRRLGVRAAITDLTQSAPDPDVFAGEAARLLNDYLGTDRAGFALFGGEAGRIERLARWPAEASPRDRPATLGDLLGSDPGPLGAGEVLAVHGQPGGPAWLAAPVWREGALAGLLYAATDRPHAWSDMDREMIRSLAGHVWTAHERRRAEQALQDREARLQMALAAAGLGDWTYDAETNRVNFSPRAAEIFGVAPGPVHTWDELAALMPETDRIAARQAVVSAMNGESYEVEYRVRRPSDGRLVWVGARGRAVVDPAGRLIGRIGMVWDQSRVKTIEAELRELNNELERRVDQRTAELQESERRFRAIFDTTFQLTSLATVDGELIVVNRAALDAVGARQEDVVGVKFWDSPWWRDLPDEVERLKAAVQRAAKGEFVRYEALHRLSQGVRTFDFSLKPVLDAQGRSAYLVAEGRDITEQKQAEDALRQAQKMEAVGQLTGGIAHDFNNLLQGLAGSLDLIRRRPGDADRVHSWAEAGLAAASRGARLTSQLLAFSRAQRLELTPITPSRLLGDMRELLQRSLGVAIDIRLDLRAGDDVRILGDETQLEMAVLNLAINARDAMPAGGRLTIATRVVEMPSDAELKAGRYLELSVHDTGTGMSAETLRRAFDPFFTTKGVGKGTGLGLSQVYGMARQMGGAARIESRPDEGSVVRVLFPVTEQPSADAPPMAELPAQSLQGARVLVIDDDPGVGRFMSDSLDTLGYDAVVTSDGRSGLMALEATQPDVVIIDYAMPGMNGAEAARAVRAHNPAMPIIFASGFPEEGDVEAAASPATLVLRKPFRIDDLRVALDRALNGAVSPEGSREASPEASPEVGLDAGLEAGLGAGLDAGLEA